MCLTLQYYYVPRLTYCDQSTTDFSLAKRCRQNCISCYAMPFVFIVTWLMLLELSYTDHNHALKWALIVHTKSFLT